MPTVKKSAFICGILFAGLALFPPAASAERVGVFFSGLCNSPGSCDAAQGNLPVLQAQLGARLIVPRLVDGEYGSCAGCHSVNDVLSAIQGKDVALIAYSAGYKALWTTVRAMQARGPDTLRRVVEIVSLEAGDGCNSFYSGVTNSVTAVRQVNPSVRFQSFTSCRFGGNHSGLPNNPGVASALANILGGTTGPGTTNALLPPPPPRTDPPPTIYGNRGLTNGINLTSLFSGTAYTGANSGMYGMGGASLFSGLFGTYQPPPMNQPPLNAFAGGAYLPPYTPPSLPPPPPMSAALSVTSSMPNGVSVSAQSPPQTANNAVYNPPPSNTAGAQQYGSTFEPTSTVSVSYEQSGATVNVTSILSSIVTRLQSIIQALAELVRLRGK